MRKIYVSLNSDGRFAYFVRPPSGGEAEVSLETVLRLTNPDEPFPYEIDRESCIHALTQTRTAV